MFNNNQNQDDNVIHPTSTQPVNDGLMGLKDDDDTSEAPADTTPKTEDTEVSDEVKAAMSEPGDDKAEETTPVPEAEATPEPEKSDDPEPEPEEKTESSDVPDLASSSTSDSDSDDLLSLKREALEELSPLVDQLDQTPEEKFETLMMMIQATDNKTLVGDVFNAAKAITDEKKRARALLDVVNEINYFTGPKK